MLVHIVPENLLQRLQRNNKHILVTPDSKLASLVTTPTKEQ